MIRVSRGWGLSVLALVLGAGLTLAGCEKKEEAAEKPAEEMGAPAPAPEEAKPAEAPAPAEEAKPEEAPKPAEPPSE
jgi:hypothetical protein